MIALLLACSGGTSSGVGPDDVVGVRVEPEEIRVETSADSPQEVQFAAFITYGDGTEVELDRVTWGSSNRSAGEIDLDGLFTTSTENGGVTSITATHLGTIGSGSATVVYVDSVFLGDLPEEIATQWEAASPSEGGPEFSYPLDGVRVPRNLGGLTFFWDRDTSDVHRLTLQSEITDVSIYLDDDEWVATAEDWARIAASNREGDVHVQIDSARWNGGTLSDVRTGGSIDMTVNRFDARGSVLYWSVEDLGIMRIPVGGQEAEPFYLGDSCIGCHAMNPEHDLMVVTEDIETGPGGFGLIDVEDPEDVARVRDPQGEPVTWTAWHPDGDILLTNAYGAFEIYDTKGTNLVRRIDVEGMTWILQPSFSPKGDQIVGVRVVDGFVDDFLFDRGELVIADFDAESTDIGAWRTLVPLGEYTNYYPTFSPAGNWIAFNRATSGAAYANPKAELWLVNPSGETLVRLDSANGVGELQNSWARWGPLPDDDVLWLAYSTLRDYPDAGSVPQIWVTAIDESLAEEGQDPSSPPFWLPGQDPHSDNHIPVWWDK